MRMVVVLPAPLSPRRAKIDPLGTRRSSPATAFFLPKCLARLRISMAGSMIAFLRRGQIKVWGFFLRRARRFAVDPGQFVFYQLVNFFPRQGAGSGLTQGF